MFGPMSAPAADSAGVNAAREGGFLLAAVEKRVLRAIARRLPRRVLPDDLTALGVFAALGICAAYAASAHSTAWLWVASGLLVVHWLGDSLDGTLARVRDIGRPRYGYHLDHLVDAFSTALIGLGLGLSPFVGFGIAAVFVCMYLVLSVNVYLESMSFGRFDISYGKLGPTEVRLILIAVNTLLALGVHGTVTVLGHALSYLDIAGLALSAGMVVMLLVRSRRNLAELAADEPAAPRR